MATKSVGIRELKAKASEIVREVEESRSPIAITVRGREVARIVPSERQWTNKEIADWIKGTQDLAEEISKYWPAGLTAEQALSEDRGRLDNR